jgi:hypothetical protein
MLDYITQRGNAAAKHWAFAGANRANTCDGRAWVRVTLARKSPVTPRLRPSSTRWSDSFVCVRF